MVFGMINRIRFIRRDDVGHLVVGNRTLTASEEEAATKGAVAVLLAVVMAKGHYQSTEGIWYGTHPDHETVFPWEGLAGITPGK